MTIDYSKSAPSGYEYVLFQFDEMGNGIPLAVVSTEKDCLPLILKDLERNHLTDEKYTPYREGNQHWTIPICNWYYIMQEIPIVQQIKIQELTKECMFFSGEIRTKDLFPKLFQITSLLGIKIGEITVDSGDHSFQVEIKPPLSTAGFAEAVSLLEQNDLLE